MYRYVHTYIVFCANLNEIHTRIQGTHAHCLPCNDSKWMSLMHERYIHSCLVRFSSCKLQGSTTLLLTMWLEVRRACTSHDCCKSNQTCTSDPVHCLWVWLHFLSGNQWCKALIHCCLFIAYTALIWEDQSASCITCQLCAFVYGRVYCLLLTHCIHDAPVHCEWSGALDSDTPVNDVHFNFSDNTGTMQCPSPANTPCSGPQHGM